ncbi:MAG: hypothetical protein U0930_15185 [Pirellulales bacterium]
MTRTYGTNPSLLPAYYGLCAGIISAALLLATLIYVFRVLNRGKANSKVFYLIAFFWAFVPPLAFWFEYYYIYQVHGDPNAFELFKHGQQVCAALWAAVVAALSSLAELMK